MIDDNHNDDDDLQSDDDDSIVDLWQSYSSNGFGFLGKPSTEFMGWRVAAHYSQRTTVLGCRLLFPAFYPTQFASRG
jgi:hypothetical protein